MRGRCRICGRYTKDVPYCSDKHKEEEIKREKAFVKFLKEEQQEVLEEYEYLKKRGFPPNLI